MGHRSNTLYAARIAGLEPPRATWPRWVVTGGGFGMLRPAPGSWGTIPPAALFGLLLLLDVGNVARSLIMLGFGLAAGVLLVLLGKWACAYYRAPDPGSVVLDEYAGFALTVLFLPVDAIATGFWQVFWITAALYVLFRATDTLKLPPGRQLEGLPWGWGILLDDCVAGVQANLLAHVGLWLLLA